MARGPLHYIILYTYSLLSLDRGWGPQSVSASACAREDRHVGGSRWADAIDIHSDAESIRIPLLVCHRVIWDPGLSGRAGLLYARGAYLGYLRLQFRTPLASPLTSLSLQNTPNNQFVKSMSDTVPGDVGKYLKLSTADTVVGTKKGEVFMCIEHSVHRSGDKSKDRLDAMVFKDQSVLAKAIAALKAADPATDTFLDVMLAHGRLKYAGLTMAKLARVFGSDAKAKVLFLAATKRVDPTLLGSYGAASPAGPLVGTTFQGTVPVVEAGGTISMVTARWLVSAGSTTEKYKVAATVSGRRMESEIESTAVQGIVTAAAAAAAAVARSAAPPPAATDAGLDSKDYPLLHAFVKHFDACTGGKIGARLLIKLADGAGLLLPPLGRDAQAAPATLRRLVMPALERFEFLLEAAATRKEKVADCLDVDAGGAEFNRLDQASGVAAALWGRAAGANTGAGLGLSPGAQQPVSFGPAVSASHPKSTNVRLDALSSLARDAAEVEIFSKDVLAWIESDASRREVIARNASARSSLIEKWLKGAGDLLDPLLIAGNPAGQDASGLLSIVLAALSSSGAAVSTTGSTGSAAVTNTDHPRRVSVTVHSSAADSATISEVERRERTQVQSDAVALEDEPASMARLQAMVRSAEAGDGGAALNKVVAAEPEGTLSRLLYSGADISSVMVDAEPSTVHAIATVRGVLNAALERAVCGSNASQPSDRLIRSLGAVRLRRLTRVRLCHLLDLDDRGTAISPLAEFGQMSSSDAITNFTMALQRMQTAWVFAAPSHAAQAMMFVSALQRECLKALTAGCSWEEIGNFYSAVIRRADRKADGFAGVPGVPEVPDAKWASDQAHEWVCLLRNRAEAARKGQIQKKERLEEMEAYRKETDKRLAEGLRKGPKSPEPKRPRGGRGKSSPGQQQWWHDDWEQQEWKPKPKGKGKGKDGKGKGKDSSKGKQSGTLSDADFAAKRAEKQEELNAKHGQKDGKNPCFFHHGTPGGCRFDAAECRQGFH